METGGKITDVVVIVSCIVGRVDARQYWDVGVARHVAACVADHLDAAWSLVILVGMEVVLVDQMSARGSGWLLLQPVFGLR